MKTFFANASYSQSDLLILYTILEVAAVLIVCTVIEFIRIYLLEKHYIGMINRMAKQIDKYKEKFFSRKILKKSKKSKRKIR